MKRRSIALVAARLAAVGALTLTLSVMAGCSTTSETKSDRSDSSSRTPSEFSQGDTPASTSKGTGASADLGTAYFDFDRSEIREDQRDALRKNAQVLKDTGSRVIIGGHADERGSEEYNLALGERRADSVRKYLSALGVSSGSMKVVSYGESKPAVRGHDESAWRWNRRADFSPQ